MNLSEKYKDLERQINSELSKRKIDFEFIFYLRSQQLQKMSAAFDLLKKKRFGISAINKRMRAAKRQSRPQTQ